MNLVTRIWFYFVLGIVLVVSFFVSFFIFIAVLLVIAVTIPFVIYLNYRAKKELEKATYPEKIRKDLRDLK